MYLDTRLRCAGCGLRLGDGPPPARCAGCGADIAEVGTWSELEEWGRTRQRGRWRFLLLRVLFLTPGVLVVWAIHAWRGETDPAVYTRGLIFPVIGFVVGCVVWRGSEREYAAAGRRDDVT